MKSVLKIKLPKLCDCIELNVPHDFHPMHVANDPNGDVCLWFSTGLPKSEWARKATIYAIGTGFGHQAADSALALGTHVGPTFVTHYFLQ